jgi:hypothetical protein
MLGYLGTLVRAAVEGWQWMTTGVLWAIDCSSNGGDWSIIGRVMALFLKNSDFFFWKFF